MSKSSVMSLIVGVAVVMVPIEAKAQFGGFGGVGPAQLGRPTNQAGRPRVSPFINLGGGGSAGVTFFGIVRPQVQANRAIQNLTLAQQLGGTTTQAGTGRSYFFNYSHYYPGLQQQGGGGFSAPIGPTFNQLGGR
ncbi:MAG: hypothetical protein ACFCD0_15170 [Gemmataceae bacterium]